MIVLEETIEVARPVEHCFRYVSDFRTTPEWDPTVLEADKMTDGGIDVGTRVAALQSGARYRVSGICHRRAHAFPAYCAVGKGSFL